MLTKQQTSSLYVAQCALEKAAQNVAFERDDVVRTLTADTDWVSLAILDAEQAAEMLRAYRRSRKR